MVHIYDGILLSHKKEQDNTIHSNTEGPRNCHSEVRQTQKNECHVILLM